MTRLDDELHTACAGGRWRIGQALNEPMPVRGDRSKRLHPRARGTARHARLRLVTDGGRAPEPRR
jgi:hypothetical protein